MPKMAAIVDYGLGNLFSVSMACLQAGLHAEITADPDAILAADVVILPGVGAFGDAMEALRQRDLVSVLRDVAAQNRPLVGICLGMQLLMTESEEFGLHRGLDLIPGRVRALRSPSEAGARFKVPHVGWSQIEAARLWTGTFLEHVPDRSYMYFVHSFTVEPKQTGQSLAITHYEDVAFCSSLQLGNIFGCQFHPERSGRTGAAIYRSIAAWGNKPVGCEHVVTPSGTTRDH